MQTVQDNQSGSRKREEHLSKDGKWRSFPKVPHLLQYVISGNYFGKVKINGKSIRQSLETSVWTTAQLKLNDFLKEHRENRDKVDVPKFIEAVETFKRELENETSIKPQSKKYRLWCLGKLQKTWPELSELRLDEITPKACIEWAAELHGTIACHYYNNTIGTLKQVIESGIGLHQERGGRGLENPAAVLKKTRITQKELRLVGKCNEALARACREIGIPKITHHDLRHLFATRCIESGVDIPTVSRWLGHKDGGALAMKVYGHLRNEHSAAMAQKVKF